jgi:GNAT superfamily N-acetyltransferase
MGAMNATVRPAQPADEEPLFALVRAFPTPTPPDAAAFRAALRTKLADDAYAVFVSEGDGRLSGYVSGYRHATFYAAGFTAWVDEILVAQDVRGRGVGKQLMEAFEGWAAAHGCVSVGLATRGAAAFYERLGYASRAAYFKKYLGPGPAAGAL